MMALRCLEASGGQFAILHGEAALAAGVCPSDVDLVSSMSAYEIIGGAYDELRRCGLHPVVVWPYDIGSASVFVVDEFAREGAQLDIVHDLSGSGHYGLKTRTLLDRVQPGVRWSRAGTEDELLYLVCKRWHKGQHDRLPELVAALRAFRRNSVRLRADELFSAPTAAMIMAVVDGQVQVANRIRRSRMQLAAAGRIASRLRRAVGFWVAVDGPTGRPTAELITSRFFRVLPTVGCGATSGRPKDAVRDVQRIARVRWRAGVYSSWGRRPALLAPDVVVHGVEGHEERVVGDVVTSMERRLRL